MSVVEDTILYINNISWYCITTDNNVRIVSVNKEFSTHGILYTIYHKHDNTIWVSQSLPTMVYVINENINDYKKRIHPSSLYRCIRGESKKGVHKNWMVNKFERRNCSDIIFDQFMKIVFIVKTPSEWKLDIIVTNVQE